MEKNIFMQSHCPVCFATRNSQCSKVQRRHTGPYFVLCFILQADNDAPHTALLVHEFLKKESISKLKSKWNDPMTLSTLTPLSMYGDVLGRRASGF
ncbi:hypothetical protein CEXT_580351 [Caerostris extrusa]|uniref:Uncharacterized protein n=1 Tax=Caerostris extrusa TaxID=172846 RepID=A0AAV4RQP0_CAEEX|nr:hypothetical protein CEXT_580351 [Caerostris extrusa]